MTDQMRMAESVRDIALAAKAAAQKLATSIGSRKRNAALDAMARALREHTGRSWPRTKPIWMRRAGRIRARACSIASCSSLQHRGDGGARGSCACRIHPLGAVQMQRRELESGIDLKRVSVPLGVVGMVYEAPERDS